MKRCLFLIVCLCSFCLSVWSQAQISFNHATHDFGIILRDKPVKAEFIVTNSGNSPLVLTNVTTSCGCTLAEWTKSPIAPGEKGVVSSVFDAKAAGRFQKTIAVYSNASPNLIYLTIKGAVANESIDFKTSHPFLIGDIRLDKNDIVFPEANKGELREINISVANTSGSAYEPVVMHLPPYLKAEAKPKVLDRGRKGTIKLTLDTEQLKDFGLTQTSVYLARFSGDKVSEENEITVSAILLPDFSHLTASQRENAPVIHLSETDIKLPITGDKDNVSHTIIITNKGKSRLEIRKLQVFNSAVGVSLHRKNIQPGASTKLKVTLYGKGLRKMRTQPKVLMITNDPAQPKVIINIKPQRTK